MELDCAPFQGGFGLLNRPWDGELTILDAPRQVRCHRGDSIFAINRNQVRQSGKEGRIRQHFRLYAIPERFVPRLQDITQSGLFLLIVAVDRSLRHDANAPIAAAD